MNLERILDKCHRGQWSIGDLDWSIPPRAMTRDEEVVIVQYFTDNSGIERLAKALFEEQRRRSRNTILREIFATFMEDEERHARVAERLAHHYNVHGYRAYELNPDLRRFAPLFIDAIRYISAEFANVYITTGELLLDVALLRSLADYVDDDMCRQAMTRIDRDESRHIAIDYYMSGYYASPAYRASVSALSWRSLVNAARALSTFTRVRWPICPQRVRRAPRQG